MLNQRSPAVKAALAPPPALGYDSQRKHEGTAMKRIVVCMDGTWQRLSRTGATNVAVIARSVAHTDAAGRQQIVVYSRGVGAMNELDESGMGALAGGAFGTGLEESILDTYLRIAFNYQPGDHIYIFGFSRGAFSARSLAALIGKCGIVSRRFAEEAPTAFKLYRDNTKGPDHQDVVRFREKTGKRVRFGGGEEESYYRTPIMYLGIFDTVGQRGIPSSLGVISDIFNQRYAFHDLDLSPMVRSARHALAIDERRWPYPPTLWTNLDTLNAARAAEDGRGPYAPEDAPYQQRWFPGTHGDVGGGTGSDLNAFALSWIVEGAERAGPSEGGRPSGLVFDRAPRSKLMWALREGAALDPLAPISAPRGLGVLYPINWPTRSRVIRSTKGLKPKRFSLDISGADLHPVVAARSLAAQGKGKRRYRPSPLRPYRQAIAAIGAAVQALAAAATLLRR